MRDDPFSKFAPRPPHIGDWEELLLRYELGPRALRNTLEREPGSADAPMELASRVADEEVLAAEWLRALREGGEVSAPWDAESAAAGGESREEALRRFSGLRARNFATLQRRGLEVWEWTAHHPAHGAVTAFQFLSAAVRRDAARLASARDTLTAGAS